jgi:hypothetical protein
VDQDKDTRRNLADLAARFAREGDAAIDYEMAKALHTETNSP